MGEKFWVIMIAGAVVASLLGFATYMSERQEEEKPGDESRPNQS